MLEFDYVDAPPSRALLEALRELIILGVHSGLHIFFFSDLGCERRDGRGVGYMDIPLSPIFSLICECALRIAVALWYWSLETW